MKKLVHFEKCNRAFLSTYGDREAYIIVSSVSVMESADMPFYYMTYINIKLKPATSDDSEFVLLNYFRHPFSLTAPIDVIHKLKNAVTNCMAIISLINSVIQNKKEYIEKNLRASVELKDGKTIKLKPVKRDDGKLVFELYDDKDYYIIIRSDSLAKLKSELNKFSKTLSKAIDSLTMNAKFNIRGLNHEVQ